MASREYLQCEPVEIDEQSFHKSHYNCNDIDIEMHELKNETFYEHIDYEEDDDSDNID